MLGLGATQINDNKTVAFVSKRLTDAKSRYANIENLVVKDSIHSYIEKNSELNLTINPSKTSKIKTLHKHPQDYKGCC